MNNHSFRTFAGLALIFIIGGLQALNGNVGSSSLLELIIPVMLGLEHLFNGNTTV